MEMIWEVLHHALEDSVKMLPFLFAAYLLIEFLEHRHSETVERVLAGGGRFGFLPGAVLGLVPQCGFSAMAANLYGSKVITLGTLIAVFIATSDEAVPILAAMPGQWGALAKLLAAKLLAAVAAGFLLDVGLKKAVPQNLRGGFSGHAGDVDCHDHEAKQSVFVAALRHTLHIFLYIFLFNLVLGAVVHAVGADAIGSFVARAGLWQPVLAGLVGLVPNCAASILLTQLYAVGQLSFAGAVAGLSTSAGVGLAVLFRANKSVKQNVFIVGLLYVLGVCAGMVAGLFG